MASARGLRSAAAAALLAAAVALAGAEWAARRFVFHVTRAEPTGLLERLEASPDLLIEVGERGRRYRAGARVRVHHHPLAREEVRIDVGEHGFRHPSLPRRRAGERRILVLGDSITAGDYLPREAVYPSRLEALLGEPSTGPARAPIAVVNAGVGNIGIDEEIAILEDRGLALGPDLVLLAFYLNDAQGAWRSDQGFAPQGLARFSVLAQTLGQLRALWRLRNSPLVAWQAQVERLAWRSDRRAFRELAQAAAFDWGVAWRPESWRRIDAGLDRLVALAHAHGFQAAVLAFPVVYQVEAEILERSPQQALAERAAQRNLPFLDLLPALRSDAGPGVFLDQCHLDARGHEVVARALRDFLLRGELLKPPRRPSAPAAS